MNRRKVKTKKTLKQKIRDTLIGLGIASIIAYPTFVGAGALYYSTSRFSSLQTPQRIESLHEYTYPNNDDCVIIVTRHNSHTGIPTYDGFFDIISLSEKSTLGIQEADFEPLLRTNFYHEIGHKLYRDLEQKKGVEAYFDRVIDISRGADSIHTYLYAYESSLKGRKREGEKNLERVIEEVHKEVVKFSAGKGKNYVFEVQNIKTPEEMYATQFEKIFGGNKNPLITDYSSDIRTTYDESIKNHPEIVYAGWKSFPKIYGRIFIEGLYSMSKYLKEHIPQIHLPRKEHRATEEELLEMKQQMQDSMKPYLE